MVNGIEFTPQEIEAVAIALDRTADAYEREAEQLEYEGQTEDAEREWKEHAVYESARQKWSAVRRESN